jgi:hypothetical protein
MFFPMLILVIVFYWVLLFFASSIIGKYTSRFRKISILSVCTKPPSENGCACITVHAMMVSLIPDKNELIPLHAMEAYLFNEKSPDQCYSTRVTCSQPGRCAFDPSIAPADPSTTTVSLPTIRSSTAPNARKSSTLVDKT